MLLPDANPCLAVSVIVFLLTCGMPANAGGRVEAAAVGQDLVAVRSEIFIRTWRDQFSSRLPDDPEEPYSFRYRAAVALANLAIYWRNPPIS